MTLKILIRVRGTEEQLNQFQEHFKKSDLYPGVEPELNKRKDMFSYFFESKTYEPYDEFSKEASITFPDVEVYSGYMPTETELKFVKYTNGERAIHPDKFMTHKSKEIE